MIKQIFQFIQNHWVLCTTFLAILLLLIFEEIKNKITGLPKISAQETVLSLNRGKAIIIDLRNKSAFINGHILGAINIVLADIDQNLGKLESYKEHALILVYDNDYNMALIGSKLKKAGFTKIYVLAGGLNAWKEAQLPLNKT